MPELGVLLILGSGALGVSWLVNSPPRFLAGRSPRTHLLIALLLGLLATGGVLSLSGPRYYRLDRAGVHVEGVVIAKEPKNHQLVRYRYSAAGRDQTGSGDAGYGNPEFEALAVGDRLRVVYLTRSPEISAPGDPHARLVNELQSAGLLGVGLAAIAYCGLRRKRAFEPARVNGWRVIGMTMLTLGVIEAVGCILLFSELARSHPAAPALCAAFTLAFFGFGIYAIRVSRRTTPAGKP
jgi:hypothetical protein